jgi:hypothetical protein
MQREQLAGQQHERQREHRQIGEPRHRSSLSRAPVTII